MTNETIDMAKLEKIVAELKKVEDLKDMDLTQKEKNIIHSSFVQKRVRKLGLKFGG